MSALQIAVISDLEAVARSLKELSEKLKESGAPALAMRLASVASETEMFSKRKQISLSWAA